MIVRKRGGVILIMIGTVLIFAALSLVFLHQNEDRQAGTAAAEHLEVLQGELTAAPAATDAMPAVTVDGEEYIGVLSIPALELELPVFSEWDYKRLKIAPCRQFGGTRTRDFVIAAHNYRAHFGRLKELTVGATVIFTETTGAVYTYTVAECAKLQPTEVQRVQESAHDLVLYTCTKGGAKRVAVFCDLAEGF